VPSHAPSNNSAPPGPSPNAGGGNGSGNAPHHPHPLSQSFTPTSHAQPVSSSSSSHHPTPSTYNAAPLPGSTLPGSSSSSRHAQYSPGSKRGPALPSMDMDVDARGGSYSKGREYEYEQRGGVHNGHANGMTLPPISPGPVRGQHKTEAW